MTPIIWCGDWATTVPILAVGPATISLAGLALPGLRRVVGLTFFGMLIPDLAAGVLLHVHLLPDGAPLWGLQYVGGGGWHDGLLIALLAAAVGWLAFHLMMHRPEQVAA